MKANLLAMSALMALSAMSLLAVGPCPTSTGGSTGGPYTTAGGGCNVVITFNANGSISTTVPNANPYDGNDDQLVGIVNLTGSAITSIFLSSTTQSIFGFDGDGACSGPYVTVNATNCPHGGVSGNVLLGNDYLGLASSFTPSGAGCPGSGCMHGTVNFAGAAAIAANGGTSWFSLEAPPSLNLQVNVPEPGSIALFGTIGMFVAFRLRRRKTNA
jgi:hypothetical protein